MFASIKMDDRANVSKAIFRFTLSTTLWYISTNFFQILDDFVGFDISGHTFLLIFSNLLITSELRLSDRQESLDSLQHVKTSIILLTLLWDFMLIQTALYYHTVLQKAIAALWAIGAWYILHILFYEDGMKRDNSIKS
jgi:EamA domain-containing membrane protein RarD